MEYSNGESDVSDVRLLLDHGVYRLVVAERGSEVEAVGIVELLKYPRKTCLSVNMLAAAPNTMGNWLVHMNEFTLDLARSLHADYVEVHGRRGWTPVLEGLGGWKLTSVQLVYDLSESHE